jgi:hypothetical protein
MPVRIIRKAAQPKPAPPPIPQPELETPAVVDTTMVGVETHPRGWKIGEAIILRKVDLTIEAGHTKFLLHKVKADVWFRMRGIDEEERRLRLTSQSGFEFDSRIDATIEKNYVMAVLPEGTVEPPVDLLLFTNRNLPRLQTSAK